MIEAIVAVDENWGIGHNNELLVHIPEDMKFFKFVTTGNKLIIVSNLSLKVYLIFLIFLYCNFST